MKLLEENVETTENGTPFYHNSSPEARSHQNSTTIRIIEGLISPTSTNVRWRNMLQQKNEVRIFFGYKARDGSIIINDAVSFLEEIVL